MPTMLLTHEPASASRVRRALRADLVAHAAAPASIEEVLLVASELVGNAIRHTARTAASDLTVSWQIADHVFAVQVSDPSAHWPVRKSAGPDDPAGRGLTIIDALASQWGIDENPGGKTVWARLPLRYARMMSA